MNTEKILGTGWQEIVSDLIKSCFKEKMEQKLEMTGQGKKAWTGKRQIPRRRRAMFCILNSVREKICFVLSKAVLKRNFHVRKEGADKLQRKYITRNLKS